MSQGILGTLSPTEGLLMISTMTFFMAVCPIEALYDNLIVVHAVFLAVLAMAFGAYFSQEMAYLHNSRNADINAVTSLLDCEGGSSDLHMQMVKQYLLLSEHNRGASRTNAYSALCIFYSACVVIVGLVCSLVIWRSIFLFTLPLGIGLWLGAFLIGAKRIGYAQPNRIMEGAFPPGVLRLPNRWHWVEDKINTQPCLQQYYKSLPRVLEELNVQQSEHRG